MGGVRPWDTARIGLLPVVTSTKAKFAKYVPTEEMP